MLSRLSFSVALAAAIALTAIVPAGADAAGAAVTIDGNIGLQSFVALTAAHVRATLDSLVIFSETAAVRSGSWPAIQAAFPAAMRGNVPDANFIYAKPNGSYWVVGKGLQPVPISDRAYFREAMSGRNAVGDIILSRSVGNVVAMVAVGLWGAFLGRLAIWVLPIVFPMVMAFGGALSLSDRRLRVGAPTPARAKAAAMQPAE